MNFMESLKKAAQNGPLSKILKRSDGGGGKASGKTAGPAKTPDSADGGAGKSEGDDASGD